MHALDAAPFLARLLAGAGAGLLTWVAASDLGSLSLDVLRVPRALGGRVAIAAGMGYAEIGTIVGLLALAHALAPVPAAAVPAVLLLVRIRVHWAAVCGMPSTAQSALAAFRGATMVDRVAILAAGFAFVTGMVAAALPASWWDPIAYHLPIVARALLEHAFIFDAGMVQTGFPLLGEAAATPAYALAGSAGAAMATLGAGIALAYASGAWAEKIASGSGRLATALVACSALWLWLAPSFYVDIPFALFAISALALPQLDREYRDLTTGAALAAGMLAGAAAAVKYPGLAVAVVAVVAAVAAAPRGERVRRSIDFVSAAIVVASGWYIRSALLTGDVMYPFLTARAHGTGAVHDFAVRYVAMTHAWCGGGATLADAIALPWRLMTDPRSFCGDPGYALDLGAIFFVLSLAALRSTVVPAAACFALTGFWFATSQQLRFLVPAVCLFAICAAVGANALTDRLRAVSRGALIALCTIGVLVNWVPGPARDASNSVSPAYGYMLGRESGDAYLSMRLESYDASLWLRANAAGAPVAALNDVRDYYFGESTAWLNPYYQSQRAIDWSTPARLRYAALAASGFRYVVVNENPAYVHRTPTGVDFRVLAADARLGILKKAFEKNGVLIYEIAEPR